MFCDDALIADSCSLRRIYFCDFKGTTQEFLISAELISLTNIENDYKLRTISEWHFHLRPHVSRNKLIFKKLLLF